MNSEDNDESSRSSSTPRMYTEVEEKQEEGRLEVWSNRRKQIRSTLKSAEKFRYERISTGDVPDPDNPEKDNSALVITAFVIAFGAVLLRVGGRAALVSTLGLDFAQDNPELQTQLDNFLQYTSNLPLGVELIAFTLAWTAVKVLCFDAGGIVLALSAGILFGGVFKGAVASAAAATIGSSVAFGLAKVDTPVRKKALEVLEEYPSLRGIEKVVAKDGIKAILTLRLAPVLPIPIGLYNYIYGVTNVPYFDFATGIFLGSLKPYLLDSYLGLFGKNLIDGTGGDSGAEDWILLVALGVSTLIGVFASQLAAETWEAVQKEVEAEKLASEQEEGTDASKKKDGITRSFLGLDLPEFLITFQTTLKEAERRMEDTIDVEFQAKVWNYTENTEDIPAHLDPAKFPDSPEIVGQYQGFKFLNAFCDGIVLSPVLFKAFFEYSDPLFDEETKMQKIQAKKKTATTVSVDEAKASVALAAMASLQDNLSSDVDTTTTTTTSSTTPQIEVYNTVNRQEDIDKYLFETIETTKSQVEKRLEEMEMQAKE